VDFALAAAARHPGWDIRVLESGGHHAHLRAPGSGWPPSSRGWAVYAGGWALEQDRSDGLPVVGLDRRRVPAHRRCEIVVRQQAVDSSVMSSGVQS
jgi:hypothetical protein